ARGQTLRPETRTGVSHHDRRHPAAVNSGLTRMTLGHFQQLPRRSDEWQGGLVRLPSWIERGPDGRPYRPWAGIWVSRKTGFVHVKIEPEPGSHDWTLALDALIEFALQQRLTGYRPGTLEVADREMGARLLDAV